MGFVTPGTFLLLLVFSTFAIARDKKIKTPPVNIEAADKVSFSLLNGLTFRRPGPADTSDRTGNLAVNPSNNDK